MHQRAGTCAPARTRPFLFLIDIDTRSVGVNIADFTAPAGYVPAKAPRPAASPARQRSAHFVKGPVPLPWLARAARLPGCALQLGILLWYRAGMEGCKDILIRRSELELFGVSRYAKARALKAMEATGLVTVTRARGRSPRATICSCPEPVPAAPPCGPASPTLPTARPAQVE